MRAGYSAETIAEQRGLKLTTIYTHFSRCIEERELQVEEVVTLDATTRRWIECAFEQLPKDARETIKPIFDAFVGRYDFGLLRCIRAGIEKIERN